MKTLLRLSLPLLIAAYAFAGTVSPDFKAGNPATPVRVMIQLVTPPSLGNLSTLQGGGASLQKQFRHFPQTIVVTVPGGLVPMLAKLPFVKYITPVRSVKRHLELTRASVGANTAFQAGLTGSGIGVAVIDSGIDTSNADLAGRVVYSEDFTGEGVTRDLYGHGTH